MKDEAPIKEEAPKGTVFTLRVPLDRDKKNVAVFYLKDMTEEVFNAARELMEKKKTFDATRMMIKNLRLGGDDPSILDGNFVASRSAADLMGEIMSPIEGELKKN